MSDELVEVFVVEGRELVDQAAAAIASLRDGRQDAAALDELFRAFHTLKGSAALMSFAAMAEVFHVGEDRLASARAADGRLDHGLVEALVAVLDQTESWLDAAARDDAIPGGGEEVAAELVEALGAEADDSAGPVATAMALADRTSLAESEKDSEAAPALRTLRVEAARVDNLAAAADELAVLKNRLGLLTAKAIRAVDPELARELGRAQAELDGQVMRLHGAVTRLRVTPLNPVFRPFPRLVRELSASLGKQVEFTVSGGDVAVDKSIVDGLFEPLLHLVRNALDHGIEPPDERLAAGKPQTALLSLTAHASREHALIEVTDDGRGIDPRTVRRAAAARGLAPAAAIEAMDDAAAVDLIFAPGFSTAREVGELSGRGVGLDAVRAAVLLLGGRVAMASEAGKGARFSIALPLNVRLARIMTVRAGDESFGIPLETIVETAHVRAASLTPVRAGRAFVWRDQPVPLMELTELLRLPPPPARDELKVLLVRAGDELTAVAVDGFGERLEAPLRPMTGLLAGAPGIAGATMVGDGRVLVVLDLPELIG